jgi:hypothetical protein
MQEPMVISFARSGSTFFIANFRAMTGTYLELDHVPIRTKDAISCVRSPIETISSFLTMNHDSVAYRHGTRVSEEDLTKYAAHRGLQLIYSYTAFYKFLDSSENIIIDYNSFTSDINTAVKSVASSLDIPLLPEYGDVLMPEDNLEENYLVASSSRDSYKKCLNIVNDLITDEAVDIFNTVASKSILLSK